MNKHAHVVTGILCSAGGIYLMARAGCVQNDAELFVYGLSTMLGATFPDVDNKNSSIGKRLKPIFWFMQSEWDHRKYITHTPVIPVITSPLLPLLLHNRMSIFIALGWFIGYMSHLLLDTFTKTGIRWAYPFNKKYYTFVKKAEKQEGKENNRYAGRFERA